MGHPCGNPKGSEYKHTTDYTKAASGNRNTNSPNEHIFALNDKYMKLVYSERITAMAPGVYYAHIRYSPARYVFLSTTTGSAPRANVAAAYAQVDGCMGISRDSTPPARETAHVATRSQEKRPPRRKILYWRWRKTRLTRGSYACAAGGIVGAERERRVDGMARMGV